MRYTPAAAFFATGYLAISANALPKPNPAATYSVVDVGGPSSAEPANTVYATVTAPSIPETVTEEPTPSTVTEDLTVTVVSPSEPTATKSWTVTIGGTEVSVSVVTTTVWESAAEEPSTLVVAETETVFYGTPPAAPTPEKTPAPCSTTSTLITTSTPCLTSSSTFKSAIPSSFSRGSSSVNASVSVRPTATRSFSYKASGTGGSSYKPTGTGSYSYKPTGTGSFLHTPTGTGVAHPSGTGVYPTGGYVVERAAYEAPSWNSTTFRFRSG